MRRSTSPTELDRIENRWRRAVREEPQSPIVREAAADIIALIAAVRLLGRRGPQPYTPHQLVQLAAASRN